MVGRCNGTLLLFKLLAGADSVNISLDLLNHLEQHLNIVQKLQKTKLH